MCRKKKMKDIYLTSSLTDVQGASTGFTLEAIWYGYTDEYAYTGSSSPETGWLPSYKIGKALAGKLSTGKVAVKTISAELAKA